MSILSLSFSPQPEENVEEIQTALLDWLHTQSHEPLACLTPRSGNILLHGVDGDSFLQSHFYKSKDGSMTKIAHMRSAHNTQIKTYNYFCCPKTLLF